MIEILVLDLGGTITYITAIIPHPSQSKCFLLFKVKVKCKQSFIVITNVVNFVEMLSLKTVNNTLRS